MTRTAVGFAALLTFASLPAHAAPPDAVAVNILTPPQVLEANPAGCEDAWFTFAFPLFDDTGVEIGVADFCVLEFHDVAVSGRLQRFASVRFTAHLEEGSISAELLNHERFDQGSQDDFTMLVRGRITGGTGAYTGARGVIGGGGTATDIFTGSDVIDFRYVFSFHAE